MASVTILIIVFFIFTLTSLRICEEDKRIATMRLGRMMPLRGPGLVFTLPSLEIWKRLEVGEVGEVLSDGKTATIGKFVIPISSEDELPQGANIRIIGFEDNFNDGKAIVELESDQRRKISCEKCGHLMRI